MNQALPFRPLQSEIADNKLITVLIIFIILLFSGCKGTGEAVSENKITWDRIGPGGGGAVFIPTYSYNSAAKFLLRCDMTGSYLTSDGGNSYSQINFPGGVSAFAWDPSDSAIVYAGSASLNRSADGGKTWEQIFPPREEITREIYQGDHADYRIETSETSLYDSESGRVGTIRADNSNPGYVYFSMGNHFYYPDKSTTRWKRLSFEQPVSYIFEGKAVQGDEVYVFTESSVYLFNKMSHSTRNRKYPESMVPAFSFSAGADTASGKIIFYALHHDTSQEIQGEFGHTEVWQSEDLGQTWNQVTDPLITNKAAGIKPSYSMISCAESDAGQTYLITNRYEEKKDNNGFIYWYGALKTNDAGKSWNWVWKGGGGSGQYAVKDGIGVSNLKDAWVEEAFGGEYIRLMDVGVAPYDGNTAIVTDWYRTMQTTDGGKNWKEIYSVQQPDGSYVSRGLDVTTAYGVHFDPFDSNHIAISYTDIGYHHSFNRGKSWTRSTEGVPAEWINTCYWIAFDPDVKGKIWSAWSLLHDFPRGKMTRNPAWKEFGKGGICISTDGGKTWQTQTEGMGDDYPSTSIIIDPLSEPGNRTLYVSVYGKGVFKSTDDGRHWKEKNNGIDENKCAFELTLTTKGVLYMTVSATPVHKNGKKGREFYPGAVYRSTDGAETWTKLPVADAPLFPNGIDFDRNNPDKIYLGCWGDIYLSDLVGSDVVRSSGGDELIDMDGGIFMSDDGGDSWKSIFDKDQYVYDVTVDPYHDGRLYCCTFNRAAYRSDDRGMSWKKLKGYDFHWGQRIVIDENEHEKIYITTFGSSVWHGIPETE